jgi:arylsulfatase A-like enzyme
LGAPRVFGASGLKKPKRILFLMTDQHRPDGIGLFGDPYAQTPVLDRLAQEGMAFRKAYTQYPLCVPARTSILLGRYTHSVSSGNWGNSIRNTEQVSFTELLQKAGWQTACFGKLHVHQRNSRDWTQLNELKKWSPAEKISRSPQIESFHQFDYPQLRPKIEPDLPYGAPSPYAEEAHLEWRTKEAVIQYMREHRDESWFLQCSFIKPHPPLNPPAEYWEKFRKISYKLPDYPKDDLKDVHPAMTERGADGTGSSTDQQIRDAMIGYYACLNFCDDMFGEVLAALDELGLRDDTLVVYTSDHGEMLWDHRLWHKNVFFDSAVRIPLILRMPGLVPSGVQSQALVEHIDLFPTFCELAGIPIPGFAQGRSLLPVLTGQSPVHKDRVYSECYYWGEDSGKVAMMFDGRYKIIDNGEQIPCELYDVKNDPLEITNCAADPAYAATAAALLAELRAWQVKDPGPDSKAGESPDAWKGRVLEPQDAYESEYLIEVRNISTRKKGKPGKWNRLLTVPAGSFETGCTYELVLDWTLKDGPADAKIFATLSGSKSAGQKPQGDNWAAKPGDSGTYRKELQTGSYDNWALGVGVVGEGSLTVNRISIKKK